MKHCSLPVLFFFCLACLLTACSRNIEENTLLETKSADETQKLLTAHPWQIEEIVDPFSGLRYKRGKLSDGKTFSIARYTYHDDGTMSGMHWDGVPLTNSTYALLDQNTIRLSSPSCIWVTDIITLTPTRFSYKSIDGSIFTFSPVAPVEK